MPSHDNLLFYELYVDEICKAVTAAHEHANVQQWNSDMMKLMNGVARPPRFLFAAQAAAVEEVKTLRERVKAHIEHYTSLAITAIHKMVEYPSTGVKADTFKSGAYKWLGKVLASPTGNMQEAANFLEDLRPKIETQRAPGFTCLNLPQLNPDLETGHHQLQPAERTPQ
ncbi:hypothetical protein JCM11641_001703 [Rhodosporidiobolus odoratus]